MASSTPPAPDAEPAPEDPGAPAEPPAAQTFVAEYIGEQRKTYQFPGAPITPERGDVCEIPHVPADGCWVVTTKDVTRLPDNHESNQPSRKPADPKLVAHSMAEHLALMQRLGIKTGEEATS